ncbi:protein POF1B isoform X4 [Hyperolius riggenbachi]|uniref:protein POF1B isoform X3 n=1 Tax=Hyperolius riggenbachi TaxID=752182 RepID=UPI0035A3139E
MSTSGYWMAENGSPTDRDNVFIERVKTYSPITKTVQVLDSPGPMSPASPGYQSVMWAPEPQIIQEVQSPGPYTQGTIRRYIVQSPEQEIQAPYSQGTLRRYIVQNPEQNVQQETVRQYIVQNPEQNVQQETVRRYVVQNPEQNVQQETVRQYIVQNPEQNVQQETVRRYVVQNPEQNVQQETVRQYIVQNPEQDVQHGTVRRYIVQNPDQSYMQGVNYLPSNHMIYEKTIRRMDKPSTTEVERQATIVRGSSVSSVNEQVIEQNNQNKVTVQSTEEVISEQNVKSNYQEKVNLQMDQVQRRSSSVSEQLDARYFGELLAELSRKNNDLYSLLLQHVERMGARKPSDSEQQEDIESLIPKGVSELTKQQIRYLLQMRQTSDKSTRLVLATFSSLKEELGHLQEDLNKLEVGKKSVERDLTFKDNQIREYETMLATLRDKNRQQQQELKDSQMKLRSLEETIQTLRNADSDKEYRLKELEYARNTLQQENKTLRVQVSETVSNPMLQAKTDEITRHYKEMIDSLREEKDKEIRSLRTQITKFQHDVTAREGSSSDLQMRLLELTASLEERDAQLKRQQEKEYSVQRIEILPPPASAGNNRGPDLHYMERGGDVDNSKPRIEILPPLPSNGANNRDPDLHYMERGGDMDNYLQSIQILPPPSSFSDNNSDTDLHLIERGYDDDDDDDMDNYLPRVEILPPPDNGDNISDPDLHYIQRGGDELFRLRQQSQVNSVTQEVITNRYSTQYPILRLLNDYKETPGYRGQHTVVVERRQGWKAE